MDAVLTVTPNPAVDIRMAVDAFRPGQKLSCDAPVYRPGGGGINVSRAIREFGGDSTAFVVTCGETGAFLAGLLDDAGIDARCFSGDGRTRQSVHVCERDSGDDFQFVPPGPEQSSGTLERLWEALRETLEQGAFDWVVGSGSLPPGLPDHFWRDLAGYCKEHGARFVLDTSGPALDAALGAGLYLVKPNRQEVERLRPHG
ncbi:MAG: PfkB family carbohydrate kinase, partial [Xanthomonadales bacterium]|nr:PfkB family carbohydrate kinase [Xanthomonadales bacterium]